MCETGRVSNCPALIMHLLIELLKVTLAKLVCNTGAWYNDVYNNLTAEYDKLKSMVSSQSPETNWRLIFVQSLSNIIHECPSALVPPYRVITDNRSIGIRLL